MMYIRNELAWNLVSIYYSRNSWHILINELTCIKKRLTDQSIDFIISFSEEKGENIRLAVSSMPADYNKVKEAIEGLNKIIEANPSVSVGSFPYGKTLWKNHENNTLVWNSFTVIESGYDFRRFEQALSILLPELLDDDYSPDNFLTAGLYLFLNILKRIKIHKNKIAGIIEDAIESLSEKFENFELQSMIDNLILDYKIEENSVFTILNDYWHEVNESHFFTEWLSSVDNLLENGFEFEFITHYILEQLGLGRTHNMLVLLLLYRWSLSRYYELNKKD